MKSSLKDIVRKLDSARKNDIYMYQENNNAHHTGSVIIYSTLSLYRHFRL